jgi:putative two-component system response regulator
MDTNLDPGAVTARMPHAESDFTMPERDDSGYRPAGYAVSGKATGPVAPAAVAGPMRVVIVDDHRTNIQLASALLAQMGGCESITFTDPVEAFEWCCLNDFDLLIVDYMMPEMDGIEFITNLRASEQFALVPMLMVTATNEREVRHRALEAGATDFLTKPIDTVEFRARVRNMLAIHKSHVEVANRAAVLSAEVRRATEAILNRERDTVMRLSRAAEFRDPETGAHIQRMARYSWLVAATITDDLEYADAILEAAPMHDVGKLGTPDHILLKPGKLTVDEFAIMKKHAEIGWVILKDGASPTLRLAAEIAYAHHEKFDGSGYPNGLAGTGIPLSGRIVAVADVFDALTSARPYKAAWEVSRAVDFLRENSGSHFDPACVNAFISRLDDALEIRSQFQDE